MNPQQIQNIRGEYLQRYRGCLGSSNKNVASDRFYREIDQSIVELNNVFNNAPHNQRNVAINSTINHLLAVMKRLHCRFPRSSSVRRAEHPGESIGNNAR